MVKHWTLGLEGQCFDKERGCLMCKKSLGTFFFFFFFFPPKKPRGLDGDT